MPLSINLDSVWKPLRLKVTQWKTKSAPCAYFNMLNNGMIWLNGEFCVQTFLAKEQGGSCLVCRPKSGNV